MTEPITLTFEDMEVTIVRTYNLTEPTVVEQTNGERILASSVQTTTRTWTNGDDGTFYDVVGYVVKADGTKDKRQPHTGVFRLYRPSFEGLPDPRQPFIDALDALALEEQD